MAVRHGTVAVATSAVKVFASQGAHGVLMLRNEDASIKVFVGGSTVTNSGATAGISVAAGASLLLHVVAGEDIWVSSASGTPNISYIFT